MEHDDPSFPAATTYNFKIHEMINLPVIIPAALIASTAGFISSGVGHLGRVLVHLWIFKK